MNIHKNFHTLYLIIFSLLFTVDSVFSSPIGTWKLYSSYTNITYVEPIGDYIFVLCEGNLFSYNKKDYSIQEHNKITGLTSQNITYIAGCESAKKLLIIYEDYTIDILSIENAEDINTIIGLKEKITAKDKTITSIHINGNYAYIITQGLGTLKINVTNNTIEETYTHGEVIPDDTRTTMTIDEYKKLSGDAKPEGPSDNNFFRIYLNDNKLYATNGIADGPSLTIRPAVVHYMELADDIKWRDLPSPNMTGKTYDYSTAICMTFDPLDTKHLFVGTKCGLFEFQNNTFVKSYNIENSTLTSSNNDPKRTYITSLLFDKEQNLWAFNGFFNLYPINKMSQTGVWETIDCKTNSQSTQNRSLEGAFISDSNGLLWFTNSNWDRSGLYAYNMQTGLLNSYLDFTNQDGQIININPYFFRPCEDSDGNIWVPTSDGPVYLDKNDINNGNCIFTQPKIDRNDGTELADYLLGNVFCYVITIDKAQRKWIGTKDAGVFVVSKDNTKEIYNFTTENSPLPSNEIYDIVIDEDTGIAYIATSKGLCSYQTDINSNYGDLDENNIYAYPNPVSPEYTGPITIKGLYEQCQIKITTPSGYIVHQGTVSNGSYIWDGCDRSGIRVASGVYMVLIETPEGTKGCVTKIAVIK